ncbi:bile acid:sodium symporter family protein [candidate division KSB1 bacterium]
MKNLFYIVIFFGIICGFFVPYFHVFIPVIPYFIGIMLYLNYLDLTPEWNKLIRKELIVTVFLSVIFMPLLVYHVLSIGMADEYRMGLFLTAIAPSGILMLVFAKFVPKKDFNLIISNFLVLQFGIIFYLPLMLEWVIGTTVQIESSRLFLQTAAIILIPYIANLVSKRVLTEPVLRMIKRTAKGIIPVMVFLIISSSINGVAEEIIWDVSLVRIAVITLSIFLIQGGAAYGAGYFLGDRSIRNTMCLIASSRNIQLILGIALINFPPLVVVPLVFAIFFHHLTNALWLWLFRK